MSSEVAITVDSAPDVGLMRPRARTSAARALRQTGLAVALGCAVASLVIADRGAGTSAADGWRAALVAVWAICAFAATRDTATDYVGDVALTASVVGALGALAASADSHDLGEARELFVDVATRLAATLLPALGAHLVLALPDGSVVGRTARRGLVVLYVAAGAGGIALMADRDRIPAVPVVVAGVTAVAIASIAGYHRYHRTTATERRRLRVIGLAAAVVAEVVLVVLALRLLTSWPDDVRPPILAATLVLPASLVAATRRHFLARVDRLLALMVSVVGVTALVVATYALVVIGLGRRPEGDERSLLISSMVAAAVIALLYPATRERLADAANRFVYGDRTAPDTTLRTFGARMTRAVPLDELMLQLAESLRRSLMLRSAEVWTGTDGRFDIAASVPRRRADAIVIGDKERSVVTRAGVSGGTWIDIWIPELARGRDTSLVRIAPVAHGGALLGLIVLERQPNSEPLTESDDEVLSELARQVGLALHNVQLDSALQASLEELQRKNVELQDSRARIVATADGERRKLERDLHDGAQQHLVAMSVKLRLARDAIDDDPHDARGLLAELGDDVQEAVQELRRLAHGIFPPLLMSGGLTDALPQVAARAALPTTVELDGVGRYGAGVEAAVYFCCLEALQNAGKHAGPEATASIRVWEADDALHFVVADNGQGFEPASAAVDGHGFVNMADRLGAVRGELTIDAAIGTGVRVQGRLPLSP